MIRRSFLAMLWFLLLPACVHTEPAPSSRPQAAPSRPALLWQVKKGGQTSWLFGTIHVGVDAHAELPVAVWEAMRTAACFMMETDPERIDADELFAMSRLAGGRTLATELSKPAWDKLSDRLAHVMPKPALLGSQPWFAAMLYLQTIAPPGKPMDGVFLSEAKTLQKRIVFLEDWREAISAFAGAVDQSDLEELVTSDELVNQQTQDLLAAYRQGDADALGKVIVGAMRGQIQAEAKMQRMLAGRNQVWLPRLEKELAVGSCFVAVGAAHLVGDQDLLTLLKKRGYTVQRVMPLAVEQAKMHNH